MKRIISILICIQVISLSCKKKSSEPVVITPVNMAVYKDTVFTNYFKRSSGWIAGDGAYSIPTNDGRSLWLFGDSHIDDYNVITKTVPCLFQVRNAGIAMSTSDPSVQATLTGSGFPRSYFSLGTDNNYWFWPGMGYQQLDTIYAFQARVKATGTGGVFGFAGVDSSYVAKVHVPDMTVSNYTLLPSKNGITFGTALVNDISTGYVYIYGTKSNGFGNDVFVARFIPSGIYSQWEYYTVAGWNNNIISIQKIYSEFTSSFNVCKIKTKYVLFTTEFSVGCDQGKNIFVSVSDYPNGPFINHHSIWVVDDLLQGHTPFFYIANAHPEFDNGKNELLVTYCINGYGSCVNTCISNRADPDTYRPKAIRIPYKLIDASL